MTEEPGGIDLLARTAAHALVPVTLVLAAAVLVKGYGGPGDGFAAGVIALSGALLQTIAAGEGRTQRRVRSSHAPRLAAAGLAVMVAVAFWPLLIGEPLLTHHPRPGHEPVRLGTLELHSATLFDLGVALTVYGFGMTLVHHLAQVPEEVE